MNGTIINIVRLISPIIKRDNDGKEIWNIKIGADNDFKDIAIDKDGYVYVSGTTRENMDDQIVETNNKENYSPPPEKYYLAKYNSSGDRLLTKFTNELDYNRNASWFDEDYNFTQGISNLKVCDDGYIYFATAGDGSNSFLTNRIIINKLDRNGEIVSKSTLSNWSYARAYKWYENR